MRDQSTQPIDATEAVMAPEPGAVPGAERVPRPAPRPALDVRGLGLRGGRGVVFADVTFQAPPGALVAVHAGAGSGRTSLLLALAGRMRFTDGDATVAGFELPRQRRDVQQVVALGLVRGVNDLDDTLRVGDIVREQTALRRHRSRRPAVADVLDAADLPLDPHRVVHDLRPDEAVRLGVALGLLSDPAVLVVDDVDDGLRHAEQDVVWQLLRQVAARGVTVVAACVDPEPMRRYADLVVGPRPAPPPTAAKARPDIAQEDTDARR